MRARTLRIAFQESFAEPLSEASKKVCGIPQRTATERPPVVLLAACTLRRGLLAHRDPLRFANQPRGDTSRRNLEHENQTTGHRCGARHRGLRGHVL